MKTLKLAAFAIALGFFAASCGNTENNVEGTDTTVVTPEAQPEVAPAPEVAPTTDTAATTAPTTDTAAKAK